MVLESNVALSEGWSLHGNQLCAPIGSLTVKEPSHLPGDEQARTQPSSEGSVSTNALGPPS